MVGFERNILCKIFSDLTSVKHINPVSYGFKLYRLLHNQLFKSCPQLKELISVLEFYPEKIIFFF